MNESNECWCSRPIRDTGSICGECSKTLSDDLIKLADLVGDIQLARTRQARFRSVYEAGSSSGERALMFAEKPAALARELVHAANGWMLRWSVREKNVSGVLRLLAEKVEVIRLEDDSPDFAAQVKALLDRSEKLVDRPTAKVFVGRCSNGDCSADLMAWPGSVEVSCWSCDAVYSVPELKAAWLEAALDLLLNSADLSRYCGMAGTPVSAEQIRRWAKAGRLPVKGHDERGRALYSVRDVVLNIERLSYEYLGNKGNREVFFPVGG